MISLFKKESEGESQISDVHDLLVDVLSKAGAHAEKLGLKPGEDHEPGVRTTGTGTSSGNNNSTTRGNR